MAKGSKWGRVEKIKQKELPGTANDCCGGIREWDRYPAWTEAMREALEQYRGSKRKWHSLIDRVSAERHLEASWKRIDDRTTGKARSRGAGVDGMTVEKFSERSEEEIPKLSEELRDGRYRSQPVRRHYIDKGKGKKRALGLACMRDKVVQENLKALIEPIFEVEFLDGSHGFRPGRSTETACRQLEGYLEDGYTVVVDADIRAFFDEIPHDRLLDEANRRIADGRILKLIRNFLEAGVMEEMKIRKPETGTPQGGIVSPLLANIYLHAVDEQLQARGIRWVRYADDLVLLCRSREEAEAALEQLREMLAEMGLSLSEEKTRIADLEHGFDFLGWHYREDRRWPRRKSERKLRAKLRLRTRRNRPGSLQEICTELEPILRGWFNHFCEGNSKAAFRRVSGWLRHRLRSIERSRRNRHGRATKWDNIRYPKAYFAARGFFDLEVHYCEYQRHHSLRP